MPRSEIKHIDSNPVMKSPVKATSIPSPSDGSLCTTFFHFDGSGQKEIGLTPGGKTQLPLRTHEGKHHLNLRSPGDTLYRDSNEFFKYTCFDKKYKALLLELKELKERIDTDYKHEQTGTRDQKHYTAVYFRIQKCIHMLKEMVNLDSHLKTYDFLSRINRAISETDFESALYNPIILARAYQNKDHRAYDATIVEQEFQGRTPLTEASINLFVVDMLSLRRIGVPERGVPVKAPRRPKLVASYAKSLSFCSPADPLPDRNTTHPLKRGHFEVVHVEEHSPAVTSSGFKPFSLCSLNSSKKKQKQIRQAFLNAEDDDDFVVQQTPKKT